MGYKKAMDNLQRLEHEVHRLISELRDTRARLARAEESCSQLQEQNRAMRLILDGEKARRETTLAKVNVLIGRIEAQLGAETVSDTRTQ